MTRSIKAHLSVIFIFIAFGLTVVFYPKLLLFIGIGFFAGVFLVLTYGILYGIFMGELTKRHPNSAKRRPPTEGNYD